MYANHGFHAVAVVAVGVVFVVELVSLMYQYSDYDYEYL